MHNAANKPDDDRLLRQLKDILLREDRDELARLREVLDRREKLSPRVSPIIEEHLDILKKHFPEEYRAAVEKIFDQRLKASKGEILSMIYPSLGRMVSKYVSHQFQMLKDNIDKEIDRRLNQGIIARIRRFFSRSPKVKESEWVLSKVDGPQIEEIYVIQRDSGLLIGSASRQEKVDMDVIAGMLTAIKAFAEDAFMRGSQDLEFIQYETYKIFMQGFPKYYIAVALTGSVSTEEREKLSEKLSRFAEEELLSNIREVTYATHLEVKQKLEKYLLPSPDAPPIS